MRLVIPDGAAAGETIAWASPSGKKVAMVLPRGSRPGETLDFPVPASALVAPPDGKAPRRRSSGSAAQKTLPTEAAVRVADP